MDKSNVRKVANDESSVQSKDLLLKKIDIRPIQLESGRLDDLLEKRKVGIYIEHKILNPIRIESIQASLNELFGICELIKNQGVSPGEFNFEKKIKYLSACNILQNHLGKESN